MLTLAFEKLHLESIVLSPDQSGFVGQNTRQKFTPLGFNYDHDELYRLIEDYWHEEWWKVERDFVAMRALGANVVRIHLQLEKFLKAPGALQDREWEQLDKLVYLAGSLGMHLDLVGLCCYHRNCVPEWYNNMDYRARWDVQAFFWKQMAERYAGMPGIFCFDLMNEPVVPGRVRPAGHWLGADFVGKAYTQFITLDGTQQDRVQTARDWISCVSAPIREADPARLITVGLVDWSLERRGLQSGFVPHRIVDLVDFIGVHLYPETGRPLHAVHVLKEFCVGKPVVIDETSALKCNQQVLEQFLHRAAGYATGFMTFYTASFSHPTLEWQIHHRHKTNETQGAFVTSLPRFLKR